MKQREYNMVVLEASEGNVIASKENHASFGKTVYLSKFDSIDNYVEITEEEALKAQEEEQLRIEEETKRGE